MPRSAWRPRRALLRSVAQGGGGDPAEPPPLLPISRLGPTENFTATRRCREPSHPTDTHVQPSAPQPHLGFPSAAGAPRLRTPILAPGKGGGEPERGENQDTAPQGSLAA